MQTKPGMSDGTGNAKGHLSKCGTTTPHSLALSVHNPTLRPPQFPDPGLHLEVISRRRTRRWGGGSRRFRDSGGAGVSEPCMFYVCHLRAIPQSGVMSSSKPDGAQEPSCLGSLPVSDAEEAKFPMPSMPIYEMGSLG